MDFEKTTIFTISVGCVFSFVFVLERKQWFVSLTMWIGCLFFVGWLVACFVCVVFEIHPAYRLHIGLHLSAHLWLVGYMATSTFPSF